MHTKIIEATSAQRGERGNWGKFLVAQFDREWGRTPKAPGCEDLHMPLLAARGWTGDHILVLDLETGEGAIFLPGGLARADLDKHRVWVCPLFQPFLDWLYQQDLDNLDALPDHVAVDFDDVEYAGYRRPGPEQVEIPSLNWRTWPPDTTR